MTFDLTLSRPTIEGLRIRETLRTWRRDDDAASRAVSDTTAPCPAARRTVRRDMAQSQHRLLALDGGGIRGVLTIEVLAAIEAHLREREGRPDLVLSDFFDYVGGTSTGAILAACVSSGMSVDRIRRFYHEEGAHMFSQASLLRRLQYSYDAEPLAQKLRAVLGPIELGDASLRTYLMLVLRNATTDSPWPLSNNPQAKYNDRARTDCNLRLPLWQLVRASAAAPTFFPPEIIRLDDTTEFAFVDGGVTTYNNPSFLLFLMATLRPYKLEWPTGEDKLLVVSVGTGRDPVLRPNLSPGGENLLANARTIPAGLMSSASMQQDLLCRAFGRCLAGLPLDRELGDLVDLSTLGTVANDGPGDGKLFTYVRYDAELTVQGLRDLELKLDPSRLTPLDAVEGKDDLAEVGRAVAKRFVSPEHYQAFPTRETTHGPNHAG